MAQRPVHHTWAPITDLSDADLDAADPELPALMSAWQERRQELPERHVTNFNDRLNREWAIETGIIEGLYTIDEGTTRLLIERGIDASLIAHDDNGRAPELVVATIRDHQEAVEWLFEIVRQERALTTSFIKELHAFMTRTQEHAAGVDAFGRPRKIALRHGAYKQRPNNPTRADGSVHQYCPYEHVDAEMDRLIEMQERHDRSMVPPDVSAAWLHHRFIQIHPFEDGNGRVARSLASLVLIRAGWFPLVINRKNRPRYINTLEAADAGDLRPFIDLVGSLQKQVCLAGLSVLGDVRREDERLERMVAAIGEKYRTNDQAGPSGGGRAKQVTGHLREIAEARFVDVCARLEASGFVSPARRSFVDVDGDKTDRRGWHRYQVTETARALGYIADTSDFHSWVRIVFVTESGRSEILLSFHSTGQEYQGAVAASMCLYRTQPASGLDSGEQRAADLQVSAPEVFEFNDHEPIDTASRRFRVWLDEALITALDQWRRGE
ncbi:MAG: Fic family protein [bacterium]|nr:Fic family protein [bacterium]